MAGFRRWAFAAPLLALAPTPVRAAGDCHVIDLDFTPAEQPNPAGMRFPLQMVAWIEDPQGNYVDTIFITQQTGTFGLGNRPGRFDFNSGPRWPYGRRLTVLPVWAHRHGLTFPEVEYQDADDDNLSHSFAQSSRELHFCRPLQRAEAGWDAGTCASTVYTDKGVMDAVKTSVYPPRNDVTRNPQTDSPSVDMYNLLNPFDAVSMATPASEVPATVSWAIPSTLPSGDYVMFVEVAREFDMNATYNDTVYPSPVGIPWLEYGLPYRGQPSVLWRMAFTLGPSETVTTATDYIGYGDPDGLDGNIRDPDATITADTPGSGAGRLELASDGTATFRIRVTTRNEDDVTAPAAPGAGHLLEAKATTATLQFTAPGDDGTLGRVRSYEVHMRVGEAITDGNFDSASPVLANIAILDPGMATQIALDGLLPETSYSVGIRAFDNCRNTSPLTIIDFTTTPRAAGEVDACFIATAAYGSVMANDVDMLRHFRDALLQKTVLGELAVEGYYTFGPAVAQVVGESDLLRATARRLLEPVVGSVRGFKL